METAVATGRLDDIAEKVATLSVAINPRHEIVPLFGFVEFNRIDVHKTKPWFTRDPKTQDSILGIEGEAIELLASNVEKEGVIEPLHVLCHEAVSPEQWGDKVKLAEKVSGWRLFELALGFRRYKAIQLAIDKGFIDPAFKVPVRIYLPAEIEAKLKGETLDHFLTKAAVSSNVFFKAYTSTEKLRITRLLIDQLRSAGKEPMHPDLLHLLGIKSSQNASEYRASLRRFLVCSNDAIYASHTGLTGNNKHDPKAEILTFTVAEHLAEKLGRNPELIQEFLTELNTELEELRNLKRNSQRKDGPAVKLLGYDSPLYNRWIDNLLLRGETCKLTLSASHYSYNLQVEEKFVSVSGVRLDLSDKTPEGFARLIDVYYKLNSLTSALRNEILRVRPYGPGDQRRQESYEGFSIPPIVYGEHYKEFIRMNRLEQYANVGALRKLYELDESLNWVLKEDVESHTSDNAFEMSDEEAVRALLKKHSLTQESVGEKVVNNWVVSRVVEENRKANTQEEQEKIVHDESKEKVEQFLKVLPLVAGTFAAYAKSLDAFHGVKVALHSMCEEIERVAKETGMSAFKAAGIKQRIDKAASAVEAFTPDREASDNVAKVLEECLKRCDENQRNNGKMSAESEPHFEEDHLQDYTPIRSEDLEDTDEADPSLHNGENSTIAEPKAEEPSSVGCQPGNNGGSEAFPELLQDRIVEQLLKPEEVGDSIKADTFASEELDQPEQNPPDETPVAAAEKVIKEFSEPAPIVDILADVDPKSTKVDKTTANHNSAESGGV